MEDNIICRLPSLRDLVENELKVRKERFLEALKAEDVSSLPRLTGVAKKLKCKKCNYLTRCFQEDDESTEAVKLGSELSASAVVDRILLLD